MSNLLFPTDHTPDEWRKLENDCYRRSAESFERCDTDGFLSQGASDAMARAYRLCAELAKNGGRSEFVGLGRLNSDGSATLTDARYVRTRYGYSWVLDTKNGTVWFRESEAKNPTKRRATDARKGYVLVRYESEAVVFTGWNPEVAPKRDAERVLIGEAYDD